MSGAFLTGGRATDHICHTIAFGFIRKNSSSGGRPSSIDVVQHDPRGIARSSHLGGLGHSMIASLL